MHVDALATSLQAQAVVPLTAAVDPASPTVTPGDLGGPGAGGVVGGSAGGTVSQETVALARVRSVTHGGGQGIEITDEMPIYVATPALLAHYGISPSDVGANTDVITGRRDLAGFEVLAPGAATPCDPSQTKCRAIGAAPAPGPAAQTARSSGIPLCRP